MRDPYDVLGVGRSATEGEIRTAFRRLAARHHPDKNPGDARAEALFLEASQAFHILSDPDRRAAWDRYGAAAFRPGGRGGSGPQVVDLSSLDGVLGDLLGALGVRSGDQLTCKLTLSFEEALRGVTRVVEVRRRDLCESCGGGGAAEGAVRVPCGACGGRGRVRYQQALLPLALERACTSCRGTGTVPERACHTCEGGGLVERRASVTVVVPPGAEDGATRVVEGAGNRVSVGRPPGNLTVRLEVRPHPLFQRKGDDLWCRVPITFSQAALGGEVEVPTLDGKARVKVPACTQPGAVLRLRGQGAPRRILGGRGDQLVEVSVEVPTALTPRARELLEELGKELGEDVQPQRRTFLARLRELFGS